MNNITRYIKPVFCTFDELPKVENKVNDVSDKIKIAGGKIISIVPYNFGYNPMMFFYTIIYESDHAFTDEELK